MFRAFFLFALTLVLIGGSLLPPSPLLMRGEHKPFYLQYFSQDNPESCHCPSHKELQKAFQDQAQRNHGKIFYMVNCGGDFSQQAVHIFREMAPMGSLSWVNVSLPLIESLIPLDFQYAIPSVSPLEKPPRAS